MIINLRKIARVFLLLLRPQECAKDRSLRPPATSSKARIDILYHLGRKKYLMATSHFAHSTTFLFTTLKVIILSRLHFWSLKFDQILAFQISQDVIYGRAKSSETNDSPLAIISTPNSFQIKNPSVKSIKSESNF